MRIELWLFAWNLHHVTFRINKIKMLPLRVEWSWVLVSNWMVPKYRFEWDWLRTNLVYHQLLGKFHIKSVLLCFEDGILLLLTFWIWTDATDTLPIYFLTLSERFNGEINFTHFKCFLDLNWCHRHITNSQVYFLTISERFSGEINFTHYKWTSPVFISIQERYDVVKQYTAFPFSCWIFRTSASAMQINGSELSIQQ